MDDMTPAQRHRNMQHIRSKDTQIEVILRKALWHAGIRYRKYYDTLPGQPEIMSMMHLMHLHWYNPFARLGMISRLRLQI